jgi:hypothetical protein
MPVPIAPAATTTAVRAVRLDRLLVNPIGPPALVPDGGS